VPRHDRYGQPQLAGHLSNQGRSGISSGCQRAHRAAQLNGAPVTQNSCDTGDGVVDGHEAAGAHSTERRDGAMLEQGSTHLQGVAVLDRQRRQR